MLRRLAIPLFPIATALTAACTHNVAEPIEESELCEDAPDATVISRTDIAPQGLALTTALYKRLAKTEKGNFVFSPFGVRAALALTSVGARGDTASELAEGLSAKGVTSKWHRSFSSVQTQVLCPQGIRSRHVEFANGIFLQDGAELKDAFVATLQRDYAALPLEADFRDDAGEARDSINSWISEQTRGKISKIATPNAVSKDTRLLLVSGLSVADRWSYAFDPKLTRLEAFYVSPSLAKKTPMMNQLETLPLVQNDNFQALMLPTERDRSAMVIFLPQEVAGLATLENQLTPQLLKTTLKALRSRSSQALVELSLPKFRMAKHTDLTAKLMDLGIQKPFLVGKANFTGIDGGDQKLFVGAAVQKTMIEVSEAGLDTQAPEIADARKTTAQPERAAVFRADHPFLFAVIDSATGELLTMGRVTNPLTR